MVVAHSGTVSLPNEKLDVQLKLKDTMCGKVKGIEEDFFFFIQKQTKWQNEVANYDTYYSLHIWIYSTYALFFFFIVKWMLKLIMHSVMLEFINVNGV